VSVAFGILMVAGIINALIPGRAEPVAGLSERDARGIFKEASDETYLDPWWELSRPSQVWKLGIWRTLDRARFCILENRRTRLGCVMLNPDGSVTVQVLRDGRPYMSYKMKKDLAAVNHWALAQVTELTLKGVLLRSAPGERVGTGGGELARGASKYAHS
jgi:hypothetical protein